MSYKIFISILLLFFQISARCQEKVIDNFLTYKMLAIDIFKSSESDLKHVLISDRFSINRKSYENYKILEFSNGTSKISFLVKEEGNYIHNMLIRDSFIKFNYGIYIGMAKKNFCKLINKEIKSDTVLVTDEDQTRDFYYKFKNDKLEEIVLLSTE